MESSRKDLRPSFQFYPGDWQRDLNLKLCSLSARGLWLEMLCIMFFSARRGYLVKNENKPYSIADLSILVGSPVDELKPLIIELEENNVLSRTEEGLIYNRRMAREADISDKRSEAAKKKWEKHYNSKAKMKQNARMEALKKMEDTGNEK